MGGGGEHGHGGEGAHGGDFRAKVWSMTSGPNCRPKHWKRNTAFAMAGIFLICIPIAMKSAELEATFEDGMVGEAIAKNHSTTKEAIEVGDSAAGYRIILALDEISMQKTYIAFDLMSINIADLPVLPNVLPYLKLLFKDETDRQVR